MQIPIDLTTVAEIPVLEAGIHIVRITGAEEKASKSSEYKQVMWHCEVLQPQAFPKWFMWSSLHPNAVFRLKQLATAVGVLHPGDFDTNDIVGREVGVRVSVKENPDNGRLGNNVEEYINVMNVEARA